MKRRDDHLGTFTQSATWSYVPSGEGASNSCSDPGVDGMILSPVGKYLQLLKEQPQLFDQAGSIDVDLLKGELEQAVGETLEYHDEHSWNAELGTYRLHADCEVQDSLGRSRQGVHVRSPALLVQVREDIVGGSLYIDSRIGRAKGPNEPDSVFKEPVYTRFVSS